MQDDHAYSESFTKSIFRDIDACSATLTGAQLEKRGVASHDLFKNRKKWTDFAKKGSDCVHFRITFSI